MTVEQLTQLIRSCSLNQMHVYLNRIYLTDLNEYAFITRFFERVAKVPKPKQRMNQHQGEVHSEHVYVQNPDNGADDRCQRCGRHSYQLPHVKADNKQ